MTQSPLEAEIIRVLSDRGLTLAIGESCTGGLIGHRLTNVPGSSVPFRGGVVAYHNDAKAGVLEVPAELLAREGAVSEGVALAMAEGARRLLGADFGLGVTGIAGPSGGSDDKPVGLTYVALVGPGVAECERHVWEGDREQNKQRSATAALEMLRRHLAQSEQAPQGGRRP
jgi:nicotinamide-nucleotide amidase